PPPAMNPWSGRDTAVEQSGPNALAVSAPQAASPQAGAVGTTVSETATSTAPTAPLPELQQQLETMVHDLAAVRQSGEQIAAGQAQMTSVPAKLETAEQDIGRGISALPPAAGATVRKPVPPPQVAPQPSIAPPPQSSIAPLPAPSPQVAPQPSSVPLP